MPMSVPRIAQPESMRDRPYAVAMNESFRIPSVNLSAPYRIEWVDVIVRVTTIARAWIVCMGVDG